MTLLRRCAGLCVLLALVPALAIAQTADGRLERIRDTKTLSIGHRTDASPFSFEDSSKQPTGYTVDLCKRVVGLIAKQLGISDLAVKWVPVTTQTRFDAVTKGEVDMECGASTVTLSRMKQVDFSSFVFVDEIGLLVKKASSAQALSDLAGKKIGVIAGTTGERALADALKRRVVSATLVPVKNREEGLAQLESDTIDAFAGDTLMLVAKASQNVDPKSYSIIADDISLEPYAIALPRGDASLRLAVNTALAEIYRSGAIGEIYGRWFAALGRPPAILKAVYLFGALPE